MATGTTARPALQAQRGGLLRRALRADAVVALALGVALILGAVPLAAVTGIGAIALEVMGVVSLLYGGWIFWSLQRNPGGYTLPVIVIALNVAWVLGSALLVFTDLVPLTTEGKWMIVLAADVGLILAAVEFYALRRARASVT